MVIENEDLADFCKRLLIFSKGLYIRKPKSSENEYKIIQRYLTRELVLLPEKPIFSRSCQLETVDVRKKEIIVTAPPFAAKYAPSQKRVVLLACTRQYCEPETTLLSYDINRYLIDETST